MIAACPSCGARYRIDTAKLRPEGARLRCSRCENVFRVRPPEVPEPESAKQVARPLQRVLGPRPPAAAEREVPRESPPEPARSAPPPPTQPASRAQRLVLVAHPEVEQARRIADALNAWGLETVLVHDGVEAILTIQRELPRLVVLDAALPKMFGFQVCELVKRNESLRVIRVILVGAIHHQDRYRRAPRELYGADAYVERHQLPQALAPLCEEFGLPLRGPRAQTAPRPATSPISSTPEKEDAAAPRFEEPTARPAPALPSATEPSALRPASESARVAPLPAASEPARSELPQPESEPGPPPARPEPVRAAPVDPALAAETAQAERLARIIVSDVVLYNPERFEAGVRDGNVLETLEAELAEGRGLFAQRVDPRVGDPGDFLERELLRVARSRGMK